MKKKSSDDFGTAFFGTGNIAVFVLDELEKAGILPDVIVTVPDSPAGRGLALKMPETKTWAMTRSIPVVQPALLKGGDPEEDILLNTPWSVFIVADYGNIIPKRILDIPHAGTLNVHPSLLPRFRGPSPIISQILEDEKEVGVTIMLMDEELDHGPIVAQASVAPDQWPLKASILGEILAREGGRLLAEILPTWIEECMQRSNQWTSDNDAVFEDPKPTLTPEPQDHSKATRTVKFGKEDGKISLIGDPYQNYLKYCAFDEWPGVFYIAETNGKSIRVKIIKATYADGIFTIQRVIPEGKREMDYQDFLRGMR